MIKTAKETTRKKPSVLMHHGFPVTYRIEVRTTQKGTDKTLKANVVLSIRKDAGRGKTLYEDGPRVLEINPEAKIEEQVRELIPSFLKRAFGIEVKRKIDGSVDDRGQLDRNSFTLTLGVLYDLDFDMLCSERNWSAGYVKEVNRSMKWLIQNFGAYPLQALNRDNCMGKIRDLSTGKKKAVISALKTFLDYEFLTHGADVDPGEWDSVTIKQKLKKHEVIQNSVFSDRDFSFEQTKEIVRRCYTGVIKVKHTLLGRLFATILMLTLGLDIYEVCALDTESFDWNCDYQGLLAVHITHYMEKSGRHFKMRELDIIKRRTLSGCALLKDIYTPYMEYFNKTVLKQAPEHPESEEGEASRHALLRSPKNIERRLTPMELEAFLQEYFQDIIDAERPSPFGKERSVAKRLKNTCKTQLRACGFDDMEFDAFFGLTPKSTRAKSYWDRAASRTLLETAFKKERWTSQLRIESDATKRQEEGVLTKAHGAKWSPERGHCSVVKLRINIPNRKEDVTGAPVRIFIAASKGRVKGRIGYVA